MADKTGKSYSGIRGWLRLGWHIARDIVTICVVIGVAGVAAHVLNQNSHDPVWEMRRQQDQELRQLDSAQFRELDTPLNK